VSANFKCFIFLELQNWGWLFVRCATQVDNRTTMVLLPLLLDWRITNSLSF